MISRDFISQLVANCDIETILSSYLQIKKSGKNSKALCPFHSEKTPSFTIYPASQSFYCFGCGAGGDVISFIMRAERLDYIDAIRFLCSSIGMVMPEDGNDETAEQKSQILQINKESARFFNACLKQPFGAIGYEYFQKRELSDKTINTFGLGYAPNSWDSLLLHLKGKGFSDKDLLASAVVSKGKSGKLYDQFRNRVMFPIIDLRQNVIGFGGRVLDDSKPKYLNSPDTLAFKKSRNLFALNFAKNNIDTKTNTLILAEGYMDVISIFSHGFHNVVATLGTSLTEEQARLISKYAKEVVIAYDSDGAGQAATLRAINLFSDAGVRSRVLHMEGAKDPDEYIKKFGEKRFSILLDDASNIIDHQLAGLKAKSDLETSEGKIAYLKQAINILTEVRNPIEREVYSAVVAKETQTTPEMIKSQVLSLITKKHQQNEKKVWRDIETNKNLYRDKINPQKGQNVKEAVTEERILAFVFKNPDFLTYLSEKLPPKDFVTDFNRRIYEQMTVLQADGVDITITTLSPEFSHEEIAAISAIIAKNNDEPNTKEALDSYIDVMISHKDKININAVKETNPAELEEYRQKMFEKKR